MKPEHIAAIVLGLGLTTGGAYVAQPFGVEDAATGGMTVIPGVAVGTPITLAGLALVAWGFGVRL